MVFDLHTSVVVVLYGRYLEIMRLLMSDNCRYLLETLEYDKQSCTGILLLFSP